MKERPILFSAPMVRAILDGRKTQTRRIVSPKLAGEWFLTPRFGLPGDHLWVKESFRLRADQDHKPPSQDYWKSKPWYEATGNGEKPSGCGGGIGRLRSSIHMPRWASRITLEITQLRVQRLHEVTQEDARAEGVNPLEKMFGGEPARLDYLAGFEIAWNQIHGPGAWTSNPRVWAISFRPLP